MNVKAGGDASSLAFILLGRCLLISGRALRRLTAAFEDEGVGGFFEQSPRKSGRLSMATSDLSLKVPFVLSTTLKNPNGLLSKRKSTDSLSK